MEKNTGSDQHFDTFTNSLHKASYYSFPYFEMFWTRKILLQILDNKAGQGNGHGHVGFMYYE